MITNNDRLILSMSILWIVVIAGCSGPTGPSSDPVTSAVTPTSSSTTSTTPPTSAGTTTSECKARQPEAGIAVPDPPPNLTADAAWELVSSFEREYKRQRLTDARSYESHVFERGSSRSSVTRIEGGYRVRITVQEFYVVERDGKNVTAKEAYPTTYRITEDRFVRDGRILACWETELVTPRPYSLTTDGDSSHRPDATTRQNSNTYLPDTIGESGPITGTASGTAAGSPRPASTA